MTSTISISASAFASGISGTEDINYGYIFNSNNSRLSDTNKQFLNSDAFNSLKVSNSKELKKWKRDVVLELKNMEISIYGDLPLFKYFANVLNPINCSFIDLMNHNHEIHTDESREILIEIETFNIEEKVKFFLSVCAELFKMKVFITLYDNNIFSLDELISFSNSSNEIEILIADFMKKGIFAVNSMEKAIQDEINSTFVLDNLITEIIDTGIDEENATKIAQSFIDCNYTSKKLRVFLNAIN